MSVGVDGRLRKQSELYRKSIEDSHRNHKEEVENLKKTHNYRVNRQKDNHNHQVSKLEKGHIETTDRIRKDQQKALKEKGDSYDDAIHKYKNEFHERSKDNIRAWKRNFKDLQEKFNKNMADTKANDQEIRNQLDKNYKENVKNIRKTASNELNSYIDSNTKDKKETNLQTRLAKNQLISEHEKDRSKLLKEEMDKRNFLKNNAVRDVQQSRELQTKNYIKGKNLAETKFDKMNEDINNRIDEEVEKREVENRNKFVEENKKRNKEFTNKKMELDRNYNKSLRDIEYRKRAEAISNSKTSKDIQERFKKNMQNQVNLQRETQMRERFDVEKRYSDRLRDTVTSYQDSIREQNIGSGEKIKSIETELTESNRKDRFDDKLARERMTNDHQVAFKYLKDQNAISQSDSRKNTNRKVEVLKESFNRSLKRAQKSSKKNFEITQREMHEDKKVLAKRLHEQNSKQTAFMKELHTVKIDKITQGYEKRIQELELQNKLIQQNSNDTIKDIIRKTNVEVERQRLAAEAGAKTRVKTERALGHEKEISLKKKMKDLEASFINKMNKQTILQRKRLKDVTFNADQKLNSEVNRYKDIIDQNNKFMAREVQRLKIASDSDRQRLITQYENRIQQLKKLYQDKMQEVKNFKQLNQA